MPKEDDKSILPTKTREDFINDMTPRIEAYKAHSDMNHPDSQPHLVGSYLGPPRLACGRGEITVSDMNQIVRVFNQLTGYNVSYDGEKNKLVY